MWLQNNYSRGIKSLKCFAPAVAQRRASFLMFPKTIVVGAYLLRKTRALRSFQISQEASKVRDAIAFRLGVESSDMLNHHSSRERDDQEWTSRACRPSHSLRRPQMRTVKRHSTRRCLIDSGALLQRGQRPQFGHPRFSNRSAVHTLFCRANHAKNFTLGGAQGFQTIRFMFVEIAPKN